MYGNFDIMLVIDFRVTLVVNAHNWQDKFLAISTKFYFFRENSVTFLFFRHLYYKANKASKNYLGEKL